LPGFREAPSVTSFGHEDSAARRGSQVSPGSRFGSPELPKLGRQGARDTWRGAGRGSGGQLEPRGRTGVGRGEDRKRVAAALLPLIVGEEARLELSHGGTTRRTQNVR
jgi:hypothetical protein